MILMMLDIWLDDRYLQGKTGVLWWGLDKSCLIDFHPTPH